MAARAWVVGLIGLFVAWFMVEVLTGTIGMFWGVYEYMNGTGLVSQAWDQKAREILSTFLVVWDYMPILVFAAFAIYIVLESMRRRPEDYMV